MEEHQGKANRWKIGIGLFLVASGVFLSLFNRWEMGGESWGYWFFARVFKESGRVVIFDRGPLYILYLYMFRWLGYPLSVTLEYLATMFITIAALIILFRPYLGVFLASLSGFLWIPLLQGIEPPVQKLALAASCLAMAARRLKDKRLSFTVSYALLGVAFMLRSTYLILLFIFIAWDSLNILKQKGGKALLSMLRPQKKDWPIFLIVLLSAYFLTMQSAHPWNNAFFADTRWFPGKNKSLFAAGFIQHYNWQYIGEEYGNFAGKDFYFTHPRFFGKAENALAMIRAKPRFAFSQFKKNIKAIIPMAVDITMLHGIYLCLARACFPFRISVGWLCFFSILAILWGAFHNPKERFMAVFAFGSILIIAPSILLLPKDRYMLAFIPVMVLSACGFGEWLGRALKIKYNVPSFLALLFFLILFSNGVFGWMGILGDFAGDIRKKDVRILEARGFSMKSSYGFLLPLVTRCRGVMAFESTFIGAFMDKPLERLHDIWEIPPFGRLGDSVYNGLSCERIDCLLISRNLTTQTGMATNSRIRYENYIKPYAKRLQAMGAVAADIPEFGEAVTFSGTHELKEQAKDE